VFRPVCWHFILQCIFFLMKLTIKIINTNNKKYLSRRKDMNPEEYLEEEEPLVPENLPKDTQWHTPAPDSRIPFEPQQVTQLSNLKVDHNLPLITEKPELKDILYTFGNLLRQIRFELPFDPPRGKGNKYKRYIESASVNDLLSDLAYVRVNTDEHRQIVKNVMHIKIPSTLSSTWADGPDCYGTTNDIWSPHYYGVQTFTVNDPLNFYVSRGYNTGKPTNDPYVHSGRDPSTNWGITKIRGHNNVLIKQVHSCCGQRYGHPGCWIGTDNNMEPILYDFAPRFHDKEGQHWALLNMSDDDKRAFWADTTLGTAWLEYSFYNDLHIQMMEIKNNITDDVLDFMNDFNQEISSSLVQNIKQLYILQHTFNRVQCTTVIDWETQAVNNLFRIEVALEELGQHTVIYKGQQLKLFDIRQFIGSSIFNKKVGKAVVVEIDRLDNLFNDLVGDYPSDATYKTMFDYFEGCVGELALLIQNPVLYDDNGLGDYIYKNLEFLREFKDKDFISFARIRDLLTSVKALETAIINTMKEFNTEILKLTKNTELTVDQLSRNLCLDYEELFEEIGRRMKSLENIGGRVRIDALKEYADDNLDPVVMNDFYIDPYRELFANLGEKQSLDDIRTEMEKIRKIVDYMWENDEDANLIDEDAKIDILTTKFTLLKQQLVKKQTSYLNAVTIAQENIENYEENMTPAFYKKLLAEIPNLIETPLIDNFNEYRDELTCTLDQVQQYYNFVREFQTELNEIADSTEKNAIQSLLTAYLKYDEDYKSHKTELLEAARILDIESEEESDKGFETDEESDEEPEIDDKGKAEETQVSEEEEELIELDRKDLVKSLAEIQVIYQDGFKTPDLVEQARLLYLRVFVIVGRSIISNTTVISFMKAYQTFWENGMVVKHRENNSLHVQIIRFDFALSCIIAFINYVLEPDNKKQITHCIMELDEQSEDGSNEKAKELVKRHMAALLKRKNITAITMSDILAYIVSTYSDLFVIPEELMETLHLKNL